MKRVLERVGRTYGELRRRKVVRTAAAYIVAAAATISFADVVLPVYDAPAWTLRVLIVLAFAGLPVAAVLAWVYDITREAPAQSPQPASVAEPAPGARPARRYRIALPATPLLGRDEEVAAAMRVLQQADSRLLTVTGTAGVGKTRLAHEVAARTSAEYRHGACFVSLAGIDTAAPLPALIAEALELPLAVNETPLRQLISFLEEKSLLLFIDNFEQIVDAAPLLGEVLAQAPDVRVLTTSRRRLRVAGETVLPLEPLPLPAPGSALDASAASQLFLAVARRNDPRFTPTAVDAQAIVQICRTVVGIPLAIELAAASVGVLSCVQIARQIEEHHELLLDARRDLPPRHQTLSAAFESSWRQLDEDERCAFRRLSVFRGGFELDDARSVAGADLRVLARLVETSLVRRPGDEHFDLLEVLRQFGAEKLAFNALERQEVEARHTNLFLARLERLDTAATGAELNAALAQLRFAHADVSAVWERIIAAQDDAALLRGTGGLYRLMEVRGRAREGAALFARAIAAVRPRAIAGDVPAASARRALGPLLTRQAACEIDVGRIIEGTVLLDEGTALVREQGDAREIAFALRTHWGIARASADYRSPAFEESLALYREIGDTRGIARALNALGGAHHGLGDYQQAKRLYRESIGLLRSIGMDAEAWPALNNLAGIAQVEGDYASARRILKDELEASRKRDDPRALTFLLQNLSWVLYRAGDHDAARRLLLESIDLAREMGYRNRLAYSLNTLARLDMEAGALVQADRTYREALAIAVNVGEAPLVSEILVGMAGLEIRRGHPERAHVILAAVEADPGCDGETRTSAQELREQLGGSAPPGAARPLEELLPELLAAGGSAALRN